MLVSVSVIPDTRYVVTEADSLHHAVRRACELMRGDWWHGAKPTPGCVFDVRSARGEDQRGWQVRYAAVFGED